MSGSGMAIMSDSSMALKPVIEDPSKPMPSANACSSSSLPIANDLSWPKMSVNQNRTNSTSSSFTRFRTSEASEAMRRPPFSRAVEPAAAGGGRPGDRV